MRRSAASAQPCAPAATRCARTLLSWLPDDLRGARVLDAGCGTGALSIEAARRGRRCRRHRHFADPDRPRAPSAFRSISAPMPFDFRRRRHARSRSWQVRLRRGDGFADPLPRRGRDADDRQPRERGRRRSLLFTFAPKTPALSVMHAVGRTVPARRSCARDRAGLGAAFAAPAGRPVRVSTAGQLGRDRRIASGFYKSQALELMPQ